MRSTLFTISLLGTAFGERPFLNEPDTGIEDVFGATPNGELIPLDGIVGLPDFEWAARKAMSLENYTYYRNGAGGEWSYRNNLEIHNQFPLRPRMMVDITNVESTLPTTILGHNVSAPFFIAPCSRGAYGNPEEAERGLIEGAASKNILYMAAFYANLAMEEIGEIASDNQTIFRQVYLDQNNTATQQIFDKAAAAGAKAIVYTVDSPANGVRHRAARFGVGSADTSYSYITWDEYERLKGMTELPIIIKGIQTVEDAQEAVARKVDAIYLSNHGGRQTDGVRSPLEVALEIHKQAPEVFSQIEVYADGGVRYGADVLRLLSLGVRAVGLGRPFMYANVYGREGVEKAIDLLRQELAWDAGNTGVADLRNISPNIVQWGWAKTDLVIPLPTATLAASLTAPEGHRNVRVVSDGTPEAWEDGMLDALFADIRRIVTLHAIPDSWLVDLDKWFWDRHPHAMSVFVGMTTQEYSVRVASPEEYNMSDRNGISVDERRGRLLFVVRGLDGVGAFLYWRRRLVSSDAAATATTPMPAPAPSYTQELDLLVWMLFWQGSREWWGRLFPPREATFDGSRQGEKTAFDQSDGPIYSYLRSPFRNPYWYPKTTTTSLRLQASTLASASFSPPPPASTSLAILPPAGRLSERNFRQARFLGDSELDNGIWIQQQLGEQLYPAGQPGTSGLEDPDSPGGSAARYAANRRTRGSRLREITRQRPMAWSWRDGNVATARETPSNTSPQPTAPFFKEMALDTAKYWQARATRVADGWRRASWEPLQDATTQRLFPKTARSLCAAGSHPNPLLHAARAETQAWQTFREAGEDCMFNRFLPTIPIPYQPEYDPYLWLRFRDLIMLGTGKNGHKRPSR
ncbi:hypothetical protein JX266_012011 [Neoarthrinium moseri]|nr:hypothetical protein JX266_012011 [Neoarthrinium moseri]